MSSQSLPELIQEVNQLSTCYGEWTTRLSDRIQEFEVMLNELDGKVEACVENSRIVLAFRRQNDKWCLLWQPNATKSPQPLTNAPVAAKIEAVNWFPTLLETMVAHHRARRDSLLGAIKTVETLLGRPGKEG